MIVHTDWTNEDTVDSPQIGHAPDPDKSVALRVCPISRPQCKFNSKLQIGQLSVSRTKIPTYQTICSFFAQHSSEPDDPSPEDIFSSDVITLKRLARKLAETSIPAKFDRGPKTKPVALRTLMSDLRVAFCMTASPSPPKTLTLRNYPI
jgi:hypothetical protein